MNLFLEKLKQYFEETPIEKIKEDWNSLAPFDNVGPTIDEFLSQQCGLMRYYGNVRYLHKPTNKIYKLNGAGGIIPYDNSTNASLPLFLVENSNDWLMIRDWYGNKKTS